MVAVFLICFGRAIPMPAWMIASVNAGIFLCGGEWFKNSSTDLEY